MDNRYCVDQARVFKENTNNSTSTIILLTVIFIGFSCFIFIRQTALGSCVMILQSQVESCHMATDMRPTPVYDVEEPDTMQHQSIDTLYSYKVTPSVVDMTISNISEMLATQKNGRVNLSSHLREEI